MVEIEAHTQGESKDEGSVLLTVILLLALLAALTISFSLTMRSSSRSVANLVDQIRAEQLLKSGISLAILHTENTDDIDTTTPIEMNVPSLGTLT